MRTTPQTPRHRTPIGRRSAVLWFRVVPVSGAVRLLGAAGDRLAGPVSGARVRRPEAPRSAARGAFLAPGGALKRREWKTRPARCARFPFAFQPQDCRVYRSAELAIDAHPKSPRRSSTRVAAKKGESETVSRFPCPCGAPGSNRFPEPRRSARAAGRLPTRLAPRDAAVPAGLGVAAHFAAAWRRRASTSRLNWECDAQRKQQEDGAHH